MKLALTLHTVVLAFYAVVLLVIPMGFLALYGVTFGPGAEVVVRFLGALAAGNAALSWLSRDQPGSALQNIAVSFAVDWLLILVVGILGQIAGAMNALGWTTVLLALIWLVVFGYFRFMKA
jgi:hypothetical protein